MNKEQIQQRIKRIINYALGQSWDTGYRASIKVIPSYEKCPPLEMKNLADTGVNIEDKKDIAIWATLLPALISSKRNGDTEFPVALKAGFSSRYLKWLTMMGECNLYEVLDILNDERILINLSAKGYKINFTKLAMDLYLFTNDRTISRWAGIAEKRNTEENEHVFE